MIKTLKMYIKCIILSLGVICLINSRVYGALQVPKNLSTGDQETLLGVLGYGTSFRLVNNPYPLGGYSGVEFGVTYEAVNVDRVSTLGDRTATEKTLIYPRLTLGKGLFENVDLFFSFLPMNERIGMGNYAAALRWGFFQAKYFPACFSLVAHGTSLNFNNLLFAQTLGSSLVGAVQLSVVSFYVGAGILFGKGQFSSDLTSSHLDTEGSSRGVQSFAGLNVSFMDLFAAFEIDNNPDTSISVKAGTRF